jgi:hypothetical protein
MRLIKIFYKFVYNDVIKLKNHDNNAKRKMMMMMMMMIKCAKYIDLLSCVRTKMLQQKSHVYDVRNQK